MTTSEAKKGGGGKLSRSETVTVRLDPKLRFLADLAARKQRRTLSSYIEWAIEESLSRVYLYEGNSHSDPGLNIADESQNLWDVDDADRFAKLAIHYPELLSHEEQILWKLLRENGRLWRGNFRGNDNEWQWEIKESSLIFERLREHWETFNKVAKNELPKSELPTWKKSAEKTSTRPSSKPPSLVDMDDDIPF